MGGMTRRLGPIAALFLALAALAGPAPGDAAHSRAAAHTLHVGLTEWAVVPSQGQLASGTLDLTVANYGRLAHELAIVPTAWWDARPAVRNGRVVGRSAVTPVVVTPGQTKSAHVYLSPGSYLLFDDLRGHYAAGGAVAIVVS